MLKLTKKKYLKLYFFAGFFALFITAFRCPYPPIYGRLDHGWEILLLRARTLDLTFGQDLIFTYGPASHLLIGSLRFIGFAEWLPALIFEIIFQAAYAALTLFLIKQIKIRWLGFSCFALHLLFVSLSRDGQNYWFLVSSLIALLATKLENAQIQPIKPTYAVYLGVLAGILALTKFTFFLLTGCLAAVGTVTLFFPGHRKPCLLWIAGICASLPITWIACGQSPNTLAAFVSGALEITKGYSRAMGIPTGLPDSTLPILACSLTIGLSVSLLLRNSHYLLLRALIAISIITSLFLVFKADMTRGGGHKYILTTFIVLLPATLCALKVTKRRCFSVALLTPALIVITNIFITDFSGLAKQITSPIRHAVRAVHIVSSPKNYIKNLTKGVDAERLEASLPAIKQAVNNSLIDVHGCHQAHAMLAGLNVECRPVPQSYSAYTPDLLEHNLQWFRDKRPPFTLFDHSSIDNRLMPQCDSLIIREILLSKSIPMLHERGFVLIKNNTQSPTSRIQERLITEGTIQFGESIMIPHTEAAILWISITFKPTLFGNLYNTMLHTPPVTAEVELITPKSEKTFTRGRIIPGIAEKGFLVSPWIDSAKSLQEALNTPQASSRASSLVINAPTPNIYHDKLDYRIHALSSP